MRGFSLVGILIAVVLVAVLAGAVLGSGSFGLRKSNQSPDNVLMQAREAAEQVQQRTEQLGLVPEQPTQKVALVALGDNGVLGKKIGCDDSIVLVDVPLRGEGNSYERAIRSLLLLPQQEISINEQAYYNALWQSDLSLGGILYADGHATLALEGNITSGGVCDDPRIDAQLLETLRQFPEITKVTITLNGSQEEYVRHFNLFGL